MHEGSLGASILPRRIFLRLDLHGGPDIEPKFS